MSSCCYHSLSRRRRLFLLWCQLWQCCWCGRYISLLKALRKCYKQEQSAHKVCSLTIAPMCSKAHRGGRKCRARSRRLSRFALVLQRVVGDFVGAWTCNHRGLLHLIHPSCFHFLFHFGSIASIASIALYSLHPFHPFHKPRLVNFDVLLELNMLALRPVAVTRKKIKKCCFCFFHSKSKRN